MGATATAPAAGSVRYEIIATKEGDGERRHRYRWHVAGLETTGDLFGEDWASERLEPMPRAILEDRWRGMLLDTSKLQQRLDAVLTDLGEALSRRKFNERAMIDGEIVGLDMVMGLDGLEAVIRDWLIERAGKVAAA